MVIQYAMKLSSHLWKSRHNVYYFRFHFNGSEVKRSLGTKCPKEAKRYALMLGSHLVSNGYASLIKILDDGMLNFSKFELQVNNGNVSVKTDGTVADNAAALKALETLLLAQNINPQSLVNSHSNSSHPSHNNFSVAQCVNDYLEDRTNSVSPKSISAFKTVFKQFVNYFGGNNPLHEINADAYTQWRSKNIDHLAPSSQDTKNNIMDVFFKWNIDRGRCSVNPVVKLLLSKNTRLKYQQEKGKPRLPYSQDALEKIFNESNRATIKKPCLFWLPVMALFTGARLEELAMVKLSSLKEYETGKWQIAFDKTKTVSSIRTIPLHPRLVDLGILDYISDLKNVWPNAEFLFPYFNSVNGRYTHKFSQDYGKYKTKLGLKVGHDFHSFRSTLIGCLTACQVNENISRIYVGHEDAINDVHHRSYASKHSFSVKDIENEVFQKMDYTKSHGFDISMIKKYDQGKFNGFLLQQRKKTKSRKS